MWKEFGAVTQKYFHDRILHKDGAESTQTFFSNSSNNLLTESAFCLVPASPVFNYLDVDASTNPSMTTERMGKWQIIVEGANTYSPNPARKAERRRMERHVYRDKGVLIATDYLVNSGGVIYAAHERIIPTPDHLLIPKNLLGNHAAIEG
jgi:glutamate dehydrogenase (NAD(P)+)